MFWHAFRSIEKQKATERKKMRRLEVITLRSTRNIPKSVISQLLRQIEKADPAERPEGIRIYHHLGVDSDLSIHVHWNSEAGRERKSPLGLMLSHALRDFGLLNHSVWIESEDNHGYDPCELSA